MAGRLLNRRDWVRGLAGLAAAAPAAALAGPSFAQSARVSDWASRLTPANPVYEPPTQLTTVLDIYRRMTAPVTIEATGPYPFVADTGANQSVMSAELAEMLGLKTGDPQPLNGVAGVQLTPTVSASLQLGARPPRRATLSVLPAADIGGAGMLGLDQLGDTRLTLDFANQSLTIDAGPALPGAGEAFSMRAHRRDGQLTLVDADLAGIGVTAFLDSGAQDTIGNMALRQLAVSRYPTVPWQPLPIVSVTGQTVDAQLADLPTLRLASVSLPSWPVAFADLHIFRMWGLTEAPAILIGVDVLSRFATVCLDFRRDEVRFRLPTPA